MFLHAQLHLRQQQPGALCLLLRSSRWTSAETILPFGTVSGFGGTEAGEWGRGPVGVASTGSPQWPGQRELEEREGPIAQLHIELAAVLHVAQSGKGNGLAQSSTSFVFIKSVGMLVLAAREDAHTRAFFPLHSVSPGNNVTELFVPSLPCVCSCSFRVALVHRRSSLQMDWRTLGRLIVSVAPVSHERWSLHGQQSDRLYCNDCLWVGPTMSAVRWDTESSRQTQTWRLSCCWLVRFGCLSVSALVFGTGECCGGSGAWSQCLLEKVLSAGECGVKPRGFGLGIFFLAPMFAPSTHVLGKPSLCHREHVALLDVVSRQCTVGTRVLLLRRYHQGQDLTTTTT